MIQACFFFSTPLVSAFLRRILTNIHTRGTCVRRKRGRGVYARESHTHTHAEDHWPSHSMHLLLRCAHVAKIYAIFSAAFVTIFVQFQPTATTIITFILHTQFHQQKKTKCAHCFPSKMPSTLPWMNWIHFPPNHLNCDNFFLLFAFVQNSKQILFSLSIKLQVNAMRTRLAKITMEMWKKNKFLKLLNLERIILRAHHMHAHMV